MGQKQESPALTISAFPDGSGQTISLRQSLERCTTADACQVLVILPEVILIRLRYHADVNFPKRVISFDMHGRIIIGSFSINFGIDDCGSNGSEDVLWGYGFFRFFCELQIVTGAGRVRRINDTIRLDAERRTDDMKKLIIFIVLAIVMGISGCVSSSTVNSNEDLPWNGRHDPYQLRGGGGK
jgi:hypothetical protein